MPNGCYYIFIFAARHGLSAFYSAAVQGRGIASVVFLGLVVTGVGRWQLLIFGTIDLMAAIWTHLSLNGTDA